MDITEQLHDDVVTVVSSLCAELPGGDGSAAGRVALAPLESGAGGPHPGPALPGPPRVGGQSLLHVPKQVQLLPQLCGQQHVRGAGAFAGLRSVSPPQVCSSLF